MELIDENKKLIKKMFEQSQDKSICKWEEKCLKYALCELNGLKQKICD